MITEMNGVEFWENWYTAGCDSGPGSRGAAAWWKADVVNDFVRDNQIHDVFDLGCGDGGQASLIRAPSYTGYDPSDTARLCAAIRVSSDRTKRIVNSPAVHRHDLALSMDVLYHLLDDAEREEHLRLLWFNARRFVLIYTTRDSSHDCPGHVRHRPPPHGWKMRIDSPDPLNNCAFFVYGVRQS